MTLVDAGDDTVTGGRLKRVGANDWHDDLCFNYGNSVTNIDIRKLNEFYLSQGKFKWLSAIL